MLPLMAVAATLAALALGGAAAAQDVHCTVDAGRDVAPISRFVYGVNGPLEGPFGTVTLTRLGGNRWTAYNWENNASNAGTDWFNQNDAFLSASDVPGAAVADTVAAARAAGAAALLTIPINGYVAADKLGGGDVAQTPDYLDVRFVREYAAKGAPFAASPDPNDGAVYEDEFVHWVETTFPGASDPAHPVFYALDNEPDLWPTTHPRIHPDATRYDELIGKAVEMATAIKAVSPGALVFGPVSYGWYGYLTLQDAPDAAGREFLAVWLDAMAAAQAAAGQPLVDVLDLHWYPEAQGGGVRITGTDTTQAVVAARLQAPRSLWDPTYTEDSWIAQWSTAGPIQLLPRLRDEIAAHAPGTRLAITEYDYGGGQDISGGIAQADVLGILGREGVFAAAFWPLADDESFVAGAFAMYLDYDGAGSRFGDVSIHAESDDPAATSVYASLDSRDPTRLVLVALNKTAAPIAASFAVAAPAGRPLVAAHAWQLTAAGAMPVDAGAFAPEARDRLAHPLPPYSVSTIEVSLPEPGAGAAAWAVAAALAGAARARRQPSTSARATSSRFHAPSPKRRSESLARL